MKGKKLLVLLAGQSNMSGRDIAGPDDLEAIPGLYAFSPDFKWKSAVDPITHDRDFVGTYAPDGSKVRSADPWDNLVPPAGGTVRGVGPGRTFGKLLLQSRPGCEVGLIPTSVGGTPVSAWKRGGKDPYSDRHPYDDAVKMAREAMKDGTLVALLWHQGESDAHRGTQSYEEDLRGIFAAFRHDLEIAADVPIILGELGSFYKEEIQKNVPSVDAASRKISSELPCSGVVRAKDLIHRGDFLHFDTRSAHLLGERYFAEYRRLTER